eukprot:COSAG03_NODE_4841_length_1414_cov_7.238783_1_plen_54_part_00
MDTGNAAAGQRDVRALGIIDLIREAPTVRPLRELLVLQLGANSGELTCCIVYV